jgi:glycosyltransferase involved in cell wall biosynthesis
MLDAEMKWSALSAATLFILPSYSEGFSMAILEALSAGKPVVITRQCNFTELSAKEFAIVIEPDADQIREALIAILSLPAGSIESLGQAARAYVEGRYSWPKVGAAMADVYDWLLGGNIPTNVDFV